MSCYIHVLQPCVPKKYNITIYPYLAPNKKNKTSGKSATSPSVVLQVPKPLLPRLLSLLCASAPRQLSAPQQLDQLSGQVVSRG